MEKHIENNIWVKYILYKQNKHNDKNEIIINDWKKNKFVELNNYVQDEYNQLINDKIIEAKNIISKSLDEKYNIKFIIQYDGDYCYGITRIKKIILNKKLDEFYQTT